MTFTAKTPATELRAIAKTLNITLVGDARKAEVKESWIAQIFEAQMIRAKVPTDHEIMLGVNAYEYYYPKHNQESALQFLSRTLEASKEYILKRLVKMLKDDYIFFPGINRYSLTPKGSRLMTQAMATQQIYVAVYDGELRGVFTHEQYSTGKMNLALIDKRHEAYKATVSISAYGLEVSSSVSSRIFDRQAVCKLVAESTDPRIQTAMKYWQRYQHIFGDCEQAA